MPNSDGWYWYHTGGEWEVIRRKTVADAGFVWVKFYRVGSDIEYEAGELPPGEWGPRVEPPVTAPHQAPRLADG